MRSMYRNATHQGENIDDILLHIAFVGEVVWCSAEITNFISGAGTRHFELSFCVELYISISVSLERGIVFLIVSLVRLAHVFSQTWFILFSSRYARTDRK